MAQSRRIATNGTCFAISAKEDNFCDFLFAYLHAISNSEKESTSIRKNLFPLGALL